MEWLGDNTWAAWLGIALVLGMAEMFSLDLILIMLAVGAVAGAITGALGAPLIAQMLVASGAAAAMLMLIRPNLVRRLHAGPELHVGHGKLVGHQALVTETMTANNPGRVKLAGEIWTAQPYDSRLTIKAGQAVEVLELRGATVYVHPIDSLES